MVASVALRPLPHLSTILSSRNKQRSHWPTSRYSSGVTKTTRAWWCSVVGVVVRCFISDSNGRAVSIFVTLSVELHRFWIIRTVAVVISETGSGFPSASHKASGALMFTLIFYSDARNAYVVLFICIYLVFFLVDQKSSNLKKIWRLNISNCFPQESGFNLMPYDLHPFLVFFTSCQWRQKGSKQIWPCLQAEALFLFW